MRIMALDVGEKRIGVAATDELQITVQAIGTINRTTLDKDIETIRNYINDYDVHLLVVGLPLRGDGEVGTQAKKVLALTEKLKEAFAGLQIETWDESMTTSEAHEVLGAAGVSQKKRKKVVDKLAAVFILESYMRGVL